MTPVEIGKTVIRTKCHINQRFWSLRRPFLLIKSCHIKQLSYYPVSYYPGVTVQGWPKELVMGCENFCNLCVAIGETAEGWGAFSLPLSLPSCSLLHLLHFPSSRGSQEDRHSDLRVSLCRFKRLLHARVLE